MGSGSVHLMDERGGRSPGSSILLKDLDLGPRLRVVLVVVKPAFFLGLAAAALALAAALAPAAMFPTCRPTFTFGTHGADLLTEVLPVWRGRGRVRGACPRKDR